MSALGDSFGCQHGYLTQYHQCPKFKLDTYQKYDIPVFEVVDRMAACRSLFHESAMLRNRSKLCGAWLLRSRGVPGKVVTNWSARLTLHSDFCRRRQAAGHFPPRAVPNLQHQIMVHPYPPHFPPLPAALARPWSPNVLAAHRLMSESYDQAVALLRLEDDDPLRLNLYADQLLTRTVPILQALEQEITEIDWLTESAQAIAVLIRELQKAAEDADAA